MKTLLALIVLAILFALATTTLAEYGLGYILISYQFFTLEMSLFQGFFLLIATAVFINVLISAFSLIGFLVRSPVVLLSRRGPLRFWLTKRRRHRTQQSTTQGLLAFVEENWDQSRKILAKTAKNSDAPQLNYLLAAKASQAMGASEKTEEYLRLAQKGLVEEDTSDSEVTIGLTRAQLQLDKFQLEESVATLTALRANAPRHPVVLKLLVQAYTALEDWDNLQKLLHYLRKYKIISGEETIKLEQQVYCSLLCDLKDSDIDISLEKMRALWQKLPAGVKNNASVVLEYVDVLLQIQNDQQRLAHHDAEKILYKSVQREWDNRLVARYGCVQGNKLNKQLLHAQAWLKSHPNNAELLLCLGRITMMTQSWAQARQYFESSLALQKTPQTYAELGRLLAAQGEHEKSVECYRSGLSLSTKSLPNLPMPV